jgi:hypothetical protein
MAAGDPVGPPDPGRVDPGADNPWHHQPRFNVVGVERSPGSRRGPMFAADSPIALTVLTPVVGPTGVLTLRTLAVVARHGPSSWHVADLATLHGVKTDVIRHTLDRLVRFDWLHVDDLQRVKVYLSGSLAQRHIDRLPAALAERYLRADPQPLNPGVHAAAPGGLGAADRILDTWAKPPSGDQPHRSAILDHRI